MSVKTDVRRRLYSVSGIDDKRDVLMAAGIVAGGLAGILIALSPAVALYHVALHVGMGTIPAVWVAIGGYVLTVAYIRFGGN